MHLTWLEPTIAHRLFQYSFTLLLGIFHDTARVSLL